MSRKAIVTGGSTGIGRSTAIALAKSGHDVAITYATSDGEARDTARLVESEGVRCIVKQLDLTLPETANGCVDEMVDAPGEIATPMNDMDAEEFDDTKRPAIPARRAGHPDEIAAVINFLASDQCGFVTGVRWPVDGGFEVATPLAATAYREAYLNKGL